MLRRRLLSLLAGSLLVVISTQALAHQRVMGMYRIDIDSERQQGRWAIRVDAIDLGGFLQLDSNGDEALSLSEFENGREAIRNYSEQRITLATDGVPCELTDFEDFVLDDLEDASLIDMRGTLQCPQRLGIVEIGNALLFDHLTAYQHFGVVRTVEGERIEHMFTFENAVIQVRVGEPVERPGDSGMTDTDQSNAPVVGPTSALQRIGLFVKEGLIHILIGYDHILFILGLAIAARNLRRLALIVTSFTAAHSITLALASLEVVTVPITVAEALIALSVAYVGLENLVSKPKRRALLAFVFGLVHGVGFSSVLAERLDVLGADGHTVQLLFGFNVGVELGQLAIVCAIYPVVALLRRKQKERFLVAPTSLAILVFGVVWFFERLL